MHIQRTPWASTDATTISETNPLMINKGIRHPLEPRASRGQLVRWIFMSLPIVWEERDEREREREVDSIDLPSVLRRWKCVLMLLERKRERFLQVVVEPGCGWRRQGDYRYTYSIPSERNDRNSYDKYLGVDAILRCIFSNEEKTQRWMLREERNMGESWGYFPLKMNGKILLLWIFLPRTKLLFILLFNVFTAWISHVDSRGRSDSRCTKNQNNYNVTAGENYYNCEIGFPIKPDRKVRRNSRRKIVNQTSNERFTLSTNYKDTTLTVWISRPINSPYIFLPLNPSRVSRDFRNEYG